MSLFLQDAVSGATGGPITGHTPDSGGSYALIGGTSPAIGSNNYVNSGGGGLVKYSVAAGGTGLDLQCSYLYPSGVVGASNNICMVWYLDGAGSNYIQAILQEGTLILATVLSGSYSPIGSPFSLTVDSAEHRFKVTSRIVSTYPVVTFWNDGTSVLSHTFASGDLPGNIATFAGSFVGINSFGTTSPTTGENIRKLAAQVNTATADGSDIWPAGLSATITEQNLPSNHNGNITVHVIGTGTSYSSSTTWTPSGVSGWSVASKTFVDTTHYTVVLTPPGAATPPAGATGTLTLTEGVTGSTTPTTAVGTPTLAIGSTVVATGSTPTLALTGTNTLWSSETPTGLFTKTGGSGASLAVPTITTNTAATDVLTSGSTADKLTITDTSTGAQATVTAAPYTAASNVLIGINRGDGVIGTVTLPLIATVELATTYGASLGLTGTLAGSGSDPWATVLPGSYGTGTAGAILGGFATGAITATQLADTIFGRPVPGSYAAGSAGAILGKLTEAYTATACGANSLGLDAEDFLSGKGALLGWVITCLSASGNNASAAGQHAVVTSVSGTTVNFTGGWSSGVTPLGVVQYAPKSPVGDKGGYSLGAAGLDSVVVEAGMNARQALSVLAAGGAGNVSGSTAGASTVVIAGAGVGTTRISAAVDAFGNRTNTLSLPT